VFELTPEQAALKAKQLGVELEPEEDLEDFVSFPQPQVPQRHSAQPYKTPAKNSETKPPSSGRLDAPEATP
jgi:hypothetical protein